MTSSKTIPAARIQSGRARRSGHGAASVIPHLNVEFSSEPAEPRDSTFDDRSPEDKQALEPARGVDRT